MQMKIKWKYNNAEIKKKKLTKKKGMAWAQIKYANFPFSVSLCSFCNVFKIKMHK